MNLYTSFVANILFPIQEKLKKHNTVQLRKAMDDSQWWSSEQLEALRLKRLRHLLTEAGNHVPYYRDLFSRIGFRPEAIFSLSELEHLPFLTKAVIRHEGERMKSDTAKDLARFNTGGSSGEPLIFFIGKERVSHDVAAKWRATRWWDVDIGDPEIVIWGSPIELGTQDHMRAIRDRLMRTELIPAFQMNDGMLDSFIARIRTCRPRMLFGYPSAISHIASYARKCGVALDDLGIKVVFVTSERLYEHQRDIIAHTFGCPVANGYGGRDAGFIAHACPEGGMHITAEDIIVEIVDAEGRVLPSGEQGEIAVTHLATSDFPFVRYRTGDIGILDDAPCPCGRGLPLLKEIQGRTTDFIVAADGTVMHGLALIYTVRDLPGVRKFKIEQLTRDETVVWIAAEASFDENSETRIVRDFKARLGANVVVRVKRVNEVPVEKSGKFRYVVSHVDS